MQPAPGSPSPVVAAASGGVRLVLRLEGAAMLVAASAAYFASGGQMWVFALIFFAPDLSFAAYALGNRVGAAAYNTVHSYVLAVVVGLAGWLTGTEWVWQVALILAAHAGFDRALGYGLKYASGFGHTHLGAIGRKR